VLSLLFFQVIAEFAEHGRQLPVLEDRRVIQVGRLAAQYDKIMSRIKTMFVRGIAPFVPSDRLVGDYNFDMVYVGLHGRRPEGKRTWHAVPIFVKGNRLVLVNLARIADAIIESTIGQRDCGGALLLKASTNRFASPGGHSR
jgi:hypothetical protein